MLHLRQIPPGTRLGPYRIDTLLGAGGSAVVYRARHDDGSDAAVKIRHRGAWDDDQRFLREFEAMRTIRIPGIVEVHEAGHTEHVVWFSMDLVHGKPFIKRIHSNEDPRSRLLKAIALSRQLMDVLDALHEAGFIHRDIKPSNVLVNRDGHARLLDFGIARVFAESEHTGTTNTRQLMGTLPYMSPEQLASLPLTPRTDIFAAGLMLHEALSAPRKKPPNAFGWIAKTCGETLPILAVMDKDIPLGLSRLVEEMTHINPQRRPSAREASQRLRSLEAGYDTGVWPEPAFVAPGPEWEEFERTILDHDTRSTWILEGPPGSGKQRLTDRIQRRAILHGAWPIEVNCEIDRVGSAIEDFLKLVLGSLRKTPRLNEALQQHAGVLRRVWPSLPISQSEMHPEPPRASQVAEAIVDLTRCASSSHSLMLIIRHGERIDELTRVVVSALSEAEARDIRTVLHVDPRRTNSQCRLMMRQLSKERCTIMQVSKPSTECLRTIATSLCPAAPPEEYGGTLLDAVAHGLAALAEWRGRPFDDPRSAPWCLALRRRPVPTALLRDLCGSSALTNPWAQETDYGWMLSADIARKTLLAQMPDYQAAASEMARAWEHQDRVNHAEVAALWLLAADVEHALPHLRHAGREALELGRYADARRWFQLLEASQKKPSHSFDEALLRTRIAMHTDPLDTAHALAMETRQRAETREERLRAEMVEAECALLQGRSRTALVVTLQISSRTSSTASEPGDARLTLEALHLAARARIALGQYADAEREMERASERLSSSHPIDLRVSHHQLRTKIAFRTDRLNEARKHGRKTLRLASESGHLAGVAHASLYMSGILRRLGKRRQAEDYARAAVEAFGNSGEVRGEAEAALALATLLGERCSASTARPLLDRSLRLARGMSLHHHMPMAMRLGLDLAVLRGDDSEAMVCLGELDTSADEEAPAAVARWWRMRGEVNRSLAVGWPHSDWGRALLHIERAWTCLAAGEPAEEEAMAALEMAEEFGFAELAQQANLIVAYTREADEWDSARRSAQRALHVQHHLGALLLQARRLDKSGAHDEARKAFITLRIRARQLGYQPAVEEADGWLSRTPS